MTEATETDPEKCYDLNRYDEPGHLIIFNHNKFDHGLDPRYGTTYDVDKLIKTFSRHLCYKIHPTHHDLTAEEIKEKIQYYASRDYSKCGSVAVFVLTHGENDGKLHARDKHYYSKEIWQPFLSSTSLQGKLKFFGFQACRAKDVRVDERRMIEIDGQNFSDLRPTGPKQPHHPDVLVAYSTVEDRSALREPARGSWFIQTLCEELMTLPGGATDLVTVLTKVHARVIEENDFEGYGGQTPTYVSFLSKPVISSLPVSSSLDSSTNGNSHQNGHSELDAGPSDSYPDNGQPGGAKHVKINVPSFPVKYSMQLARRALIYYDKEHSNKAKLLQMVFQNIKLDVTCREVNRSFRADIIKEASLCAQEMNTSCLVVAVLATMSEDFVHINEGHDIKIEDVWKPFIALKCEGLASKPKLFFFLDAYNKDIPNTESSVQMDGPLTVETIARIPYYVTEHSDFLFVRGFGDKFVDEMFAELGSSSSESLVKVVTRALGKSEVTKSGLLSHIESTLRYAVVFKEQQQVQMAQVAQVPPASPPRMETDDAGPSTSSASEGPPAKKICTQGTSNGSGPSSQSSNNPISTTRSKPPEGMDRAKLTSIECLQSNVPYEVYLMKWEKNRYKKPKGQKGKNLGLVVYLLDKVSGEPIKVYLPRSEIKGRKPEYEAPNLRQYNEGEGSPYMLTVLADKVLMVRQ